MDTLKYQVFPCHNFPRHVLLHYHILYPVTIIIHEILDWAHYSHDNNYESAFLGIIVNNVLFHMVMI